MSNTNSSIIATLNDPSESGTSGKVEPNELAGRVRVSAGTVAIAAADFDAIGDTVRLTRLPTNALIIQLWLAADDLGADSCDLGLYLPNGGAAVDADAYIDDIDMAGAATAWTNYAYVNGVKDLTTVGQKVFEDANLTTDPGGFYDLVLTRMNTTGTEAAGDISWIVLYVVD
jgi:hypothetical protein